MSQQTFPTFSTLFPPFLTIHHPHKKYEFINVNLHLNANGLFLPTHMKSVRRHSSISKCNNFENNICLKKKLFIKIILIGLKIKFLL